MANETELSNISHPTDVISDAISAPLVQAVVAAPLIYTEDLPSGTNVKKFRKGGSLTAEAIAESAAYTFSASSEYTETEVAATATKFGVVSKLTVEAVEFSSIDAGKIYREQGLAIARDLDDEILALTAGLSNSVTCSSILTVNDIMQALYLVQSSTAGVSGGRLAGLFDYKGINEIRKEVLASGAAAYTQANQTSLLSGLQAPNGFVGEVPGVSLYQTNGLPTASTDDVAAVFDPALCFAGMVGAVKSRVVWKGSEGFFDELASYAMADFVEWNDAAGCAVKSDT